MIKFLWGKKGFFLILEMSPKYSLSDVGGHSIKRKAAI